MSILISTQGLSKSFGSQNLFEDISFGIEAGQKLGLVGPNGAGKSTLLKILSQQLDADEGDVVRSKGVRVGYLSQSPNFPDSATIEDVLLEGITDDPDLLAEFPKQMSQLNLESAGLDPTTPMGQLSGGWKKRVAIIQQLIHLPDLLLLDEPTNHLDIPSILWLEKLITQMKAATLTVTHDRLFLQRIAHKILDLDRKNPGGLLSFDGGYADYLEQKEALLEQQRHQEASLRNTLRKETAWLRAGVKARTTKQKARAGRVGQIQEKTEELAQRNQHRNTKIDFQGAEKNPKKLIEAKEISKAYGQRSLFHDLDLLITPKTRLGLIGRNGSGKSTLIRTLIGQEPPDAGEIRFADPIEIAYFEQSREELDPRKTLVQTICPDGDYVNYRGEYIFARSYLSRFLFRKEQMDLPVEKLSGGEKSRIRIAQLMLKSAQVLVLDEPTNDLDLETLRVLENSLQEFPGAVILVSHDRFFLDSVSNKILAFDDSHPLENHLEWFADYAQWEQWASSKKSSRKAFQSLEEDNSTGEPFTTSSELHQENKKPGVPNKGKLSYKEKRELESMEQTILAAESRLEELHELSTRPETLENPEKVHSITTELSDVSQKIERLYARWAELEPFSK